MTNIIRKISKIILVILIIQIIFAIENISKAAWWDEIESSASNFLQSGKDAASSGEVTSTTEDGKKITISTPSDNDLKTIINNIYNILFPLGVAITVIIGGALGIKFMMASAEDKAKVKESLVPYAVGCIVIYGAFGIWKLAITIFSTMG